MKIAVAADHAGFPAKHAVIKQVLALGHEVTDFGTNSPESCDYPDLAEPAARAVAAGTCDRAVLICGAGIGMSMAANKVEGVRAAACQSPRHWIFSEVPPGTESFWVPRGLMVNW